MTILTTVIAIALAQEVLGWPDWLWLVFGFLLLSKVLSVFAEQAKVSD